MDFLLDLLQGAGIAAAIGIRPFLPVLLVGALAAANLGIDFDGTDFAFLEEAPALAIVLVLLALATFAVRRSGPEAPERPPYVCDLRGARRRPRRAPGRGLARRPRPPDRRRRDRRRGRARRSASSRCATCSTRTRRRLDAETAGTLPLYAEGAALAAAGLSVLFPPLAILVIAGLVALLVGGRRRSGEKYAGLRILR